MDADAFLRAACLTYSGEVPDLARATAVRPNSPTDLAVAAACNDVGAVRALLSDNVDDAIGPFGWSPLMYVAYSRVSGDAIETATVLLDAGANPNDRRLFGGLEPPFTVLTGVFGGGEHGEPPHEKSIALARLLLERGADPNDEQTLYNRQFTTDDDFLNVLFEYGLDPSGTGVGRLFNWAVFHDQRARVRLLVDRGVDAAGSVEVALAQGHSELVEVLLSAGATRPALSPLEDFVAAAMAGGDVGGFAPSIVADARTRWPALMVRAAGHGRISAVNTLVDAGFDIDALGRSDIDSPQRWQTALHTAVERDDPQMLERLLELGADPTIRDARFDGTARDWAVHQKFERLIPVIDRFAV